MQNAAHASTAAQWQSLTETGAPGDYSGKPVLMRITADLFVARQTHSGEEIARFQEIAQHLMGDIDAASLLPIAEKLVRHKDTPKAVLQALLKRGGQLAACVFEHGTEMDRALLLDTAKWGDQNVAMAIARRPMFDDQLTRLLCERPEEDVVTTLLENPATSFDTGSIAYLLRRARKSPMLAQALAARSDLVADMAPLFLWAPGSVRGDIILAARRMDLGDFSRNRPTGEETALHLKLERLALARETPAFEAALAEALGCTQDSVDLMMQDERGESLAIALASIGQPEESAARIFMMADPAIALSVDKVHKLTELVRVLQRRTAQRLTCTMLGLPPIIPARPVQTGATARELPSRPAVQGLGHTAPHAEVVEFPHLRVSA